jgi:hypothetical protein
MNKKGSCIRNRSNFSIPKSYHLIDKKDYNPDMLNMYIDNDAAPKLKLLLEQIRLLDEQDMKESNKLYKHLIFTDVNSSVYGAKIIASALTANGMNLVYHPQGTGFSMTDDGELLKTKNNNYAVLLSKAFYERPVNAKLRKVVLDKYNSRPDNIQGKLIRFIVLDQGFKEGIDLFDVKYVHLFEPLAVNADEKQAIGRATRFCGQRGLVFHPRYGWPLYVFKYDVVIPKELRSAYMDSTTLFELYIKNSNLDMRKIIFANELEKATIGSSVDMELNKAVHLFSIEKPGDILKGNSRLSGGAPKAAKASKSKEVKAKAMKVSKAKVAKVAKVAKSPKVPKAKKSPKAKVPKVPKAKADKAIAPKKKMGLVAMQKYIKTNFARFKYPPLVLENKCVGGSFGGGANGNLVSFTPTQDFVRHYFQPASAYKGLLLHHSVGTGKTCTAIATATTSFDVQNYTILWVTRHTLKNDIWKNMFGQVCSIDIQEKIKKGLVLPNKITSKSKYISANWMDPISYKQFSNMLLKRNKVYSEMVNRNGADDPLRKTLLIIDEAHKLYSPTVAQSEKPNTDILEKMIQESYKKSGADSVRVLLMTATPFTEDGMEMIKLLNLLREENKFETNFNGFSQTYLDSDGYFTKTGLKDFQDNVSGYISYLNRSQDARNFAHPVIKNIYAKMSKEKADADAKDAKDTNALKISKDTKDNIREIKKELKEILKQEKGTNGKELKACIKLAKANLKANIKKLTALRKDGEKKCKKEPKDQRDACNNKVMTEYNNILAQINANSEKELDDCNNKSILGNSNSMIKKRRERMDMLNGEVESYNARVAIIKEHKSNNKHLKDGVKAINIKKKDIKEQVKALKLQIKPKEDNYKQAMSDVKDMLSKKDKITARKFLKKEYAPLFLEMKELKELRAKASKLNTQVQVFKVANGLKKMKKISQQYAIDKYCYGTKAPKGKGAPRKALGVKMATKKRVKMGMN